MLAALLQIVKIQGATTRSSYNLSWVVYGFTFAALGGPEMLLTILFAHLAEWIWHHYPWYIQSFNISSFALTSVLAGLFYSVAQVLPVPIADARNMLAILGSMLIFTLVNHLLVGLVVQWARGQSLSQSGVFTLTTLTIDFGLLCLGVAIALVAEVNVWAVLFLLVVAYLLQSALRVPALERKNEQDAKTGLYNAEHFNQALERELLRAETRPASGCGHGRSRPAARPEQQLWASCRRRCDQEGRPNLTGLGARE